MVSAMEYKSTEGTKKRDKKSPKWAIRTCFAKYGQAKKHTMLAKRIVVCKDYAGEEQRGSKKDDRFKQYMNSVKNQDKKRGDQTKQQNKDTNKPTEDKN